MSMLAILVAAIGNGWGELISWLTDPYRPELHYMRGPRPKNRAKNGTEPVPASSTHSDKREGWAHGKLRKS